MVYLHILIAKYVKQTSKHSNFFKKGDKHTGVRNCKSMRMYTDLAVSCITRNSWSVMQNIRGLFFHDDGKRYKHYFDFPPRNAAKPKFSPITFSPLSAPNTSMRW